MLQQKEKEESEKKGKVCVTGGTGFVASRLIMRLLQHGYTVNTTVRSNPDGSKKDITFLTDLPGAAERLHIFNADLENPDSFEAAIKGCIGVFHVAHPIDYDIKDIEEMITSDKSVKATLGILKACLNSKTVKRVVYTSSVWSVVFNEKGPDVLDEEWWSDVNPIRKNMNFVGAARAVSKTITERAALEFAESNSLDVVTVIPTWINGPFLCPGCPRSVQSSLAMIMGNKNRIKYHERIPFVHPDDVASAHIFLFEYPEAKGRYICTAVEIPVDKLIEFVSQRYPKFEILNTSSLINETIKVKNLSSKKLLDTGFRYKYGLEEMYDEAIECCKKKGIL